MARSFAMMIVLTAALVSTKYHDIHYHEPEYMDLEELEETVDSVAKYSSTESYREYGSEEEFNENDFAVSTLLSSES